jgi:lipopolysaccharide/colanic/teichoic acid biosynthesis glycosyltransferase
MAEDKILLDETSFFFRVIKRFFDLVISIILLPVLILISIFIFILNMFFNTGKTFYIQKRMGKDCKPFYAIKFRTMNSTNRIIRKYSDPLEIDRITKLGAFLRKTKIDELPQILNVINGDMSLIGPRPDFYDHALSFLRYDPLYKFRYTIRPGISGLSQIRLGYVEGLAATKKKSKIDIFYIQNASIKLDLLILFGTLLIILKSLSKYDQIK